MHFPTSYSWGSFGINNFEKQTPRQSVSGTPLPHLLKDVCFEFYAVLIRLCRGIKLLSFWAIFFFSSGLSNFWVNSYCSEKLESFVILQSIKGAILAKTVFGCVEIVSFREKLGTYEFQTL